ncbi:D-ribose pyranase [Orbus mooreae]|uniref:D-ribose pyranase n=1 Tax=Orbus mooreae TaxID=3074107 RepID=UPI00370D6A32
MRKGSLLNSSICQTISKLGHTDAITIGDAGLPIPDSTHRIDLALTKGIPSFLQVLNIVVTEMQVEKVILAEEIKQYNPAIYTQIIEQITLLEQSQHNQIVIEFMSHEQFKVATANSKAIIRTGECTPYANIILQSGVTF